MKYSDINIFWQYKICVLHFVNEFFNLLQLIYYLQYFFILMKLYFLL